jgi:hypothetical protein
MDNKFEDFYKLLEAGSKKGNLLLWMKKDVLQHKIGRDYLFP